ncbi:DUF4233 domain-containing protein [Ornithinimicrobium sp. W1679]|uniref:DUF4233 domain-containing protein n=1 Tax=unclassified Ornithinimicrobium TaxID=2615080 RepID=UPI003CF8BD87
MTSPRPSLLRPPVPGPMTRRLCGAALVAQSVSVFFGALVVWQLARVTGGDAFADPVVLLVGGIALALLCLLASGALRSRAGVWLGWLCQLLTLASALVLPAMAVVAVLFGGLWWLCLTQGQRIDADRARWAAEAEGLDG